MIFRANLHKKTTSFMSDSMDFVSYKTKNDFSGCTTSMISYEKLSTGYRFYVSQVTDQNKK